MWPYSFSRSIVQATARTSEAGSGDQLLLASALIIVFVFLLCSSGDILATVMIRVAALRLAICFGRSSLNIVWWTLKDPTWWFPHLDSNDRFDRSLSRLPLRVQKNLSPKWKATQLRGQPIGPDNPVDGLFRFSDRTLLNEHLKAQHFPGGFAITRALEPLSLLRRIGRGHGIGRDRFAERVNRDKRSRSYVSNASANPSSHTARRVGEVAQLRVGAIASDRDCTGPREDDNRIFALVERLYLCGCKRISGTYSFLLALCQQDPTNTNEHYSNRKDRSLP